MLENNANPNQHTSFGHSLIKSAIIQNNAPLVKALIDADADLSFADKYHSNPLPNNMNLLDIATHHKNEIIIDLLKNQGLVSSKLIGLY